MPALKTFKPLTFAAVPAVLGTLAATSLAMAELPPRLSDTGLFVEGSHTIRAENMLYAPQYPLWSDGASKRRWLYLPPGSAIDATDPDIWDFPIGTRLWKEFSQERPIETRFIERLADGSWQYATYVWNADGTDALLAPAEGIPDHQARAAPNGRYPIPSREDCLACHEGAVVPVLGIGALQLSPDRDENSVHAEPHDPANLTLADFVARGSVTNLPKALVDTPPRIQASSPTERAALGYLHANCGHCHNNAGPLTLLDLVLAQSVGKEHASKDDVLRTLVGKPSDFQMSGANLRVVPGEPRHSVLTLRMRARDALSQMPPLGIQTSDHDAIALIERWIQQEL